MKLLFKIFNALLMMVSILFSGAFLNAMEQNIAEQSNVNVIIGTIENKLRQPFYINDWTTSSSKGVPRNVYQFDGSPKQIFYKNIPFAREAKPNLDVIKLSFRFPDNDFYWLSLRIYYHEMKNKLEIGIIRESHSFAPTGNKLLFSQEISVKPHEIVNLLVNVIIEGENFENSKIIIEEQPRNTASLRESAIKNVADMIKAKKISLEQAKRSLPWDLHELLDAYLQK